MAELSYPEAVCILVRCPMVNRIAGCQPPAGVAPLLRFRLPSHPGVVGVVLACLLAAVVVHVWVVRLVGSVPALGVECWVGAGVRSECCGCPPLLQRCAALLCYAPLCAALHCSSVHPCRLCVPGRCAALCCSALLCRDVCCATLFRCAPPAALCAWALHCSALLRCDVCCTAMFHCAPLSALCAWALHCDVCCVALLRCSVASLCRLCAPGRCDALSCSFLASMHLNLVALHAALSHCAPLSAPPACVWRCSALIRSGFSSALLCCTACRPVRPLQ